MEPNGEGESAVGLKITELSLTGETDWVYNTFQSDWVGRFQFELRVGVGGTFRSSL